MEQALAIPFANLDLQIHQASYVGGDAWWMDSKGNDWWSRSWKPKFNVLYYVKKGRFTLCMENQRYTISAGQMVFIPAYTDVRLAMDDSRELDKYYTHFQLLLGNRTPTDRYDFARVAQPRDRENVERLFSELVDGQDPMGLTESGALLQLLGLFFAAAQPHVRKNEGSLTAAVDYIHTHSADNFPIAHLAELCGYSKDHFTRKFKDAYGRTPRQYIAEYRLQQAKERLINTNRSVVSIAEELGFGSAGYFTNFFCQKTGLSPSFYRKTVRDKR